MDAFYFCGGSFPLRAGFPHDRWLRAFFYALYALKSRIQRIKCAQAPLHRAIPRYPLGEDDLPFLV